MHGVHQLPSEFASALEIARPRLAPLATTVLYFPTIGSTNDVAAARATREHEGLVVLADEQTAGRGRSGHDWLSPAGTGLYVSVVLAPSRASADVLRAKLLLTIAAGVGIAEGIERATGIAPAIKWPNDLVIADRKVCGILAEASGEVVLGYGVNVGSMSFPPELSGRATSLETELGRRVDRSLVFAETLAGLAARYRELIAGNFGAILDAWRKRAPSSTGVPVTWNTAGGPRTGTTAGIDDDGALLVRVGDRIERLIAGEVIEIRPRSRT